MTTMMRPITVARIKLTRREKPGRDLAAEVEAAPEIIKMAVGGVDVCLDQDLAHQGPPGAVQDLVQRTGVERGDHLAPEVGQGIVRGRHGGKGGSHEDPVPGAGPNPVPVPETETGTVTGIKGEGTIGGQGVGHMTGHVIVGGRGPVRGRRTREDGATVLAHGHVTVTVIGERLKPDSRIVCVSACHWMLP